MLFSRICSTDVEDSVKVNTFTDYSINYVCTMGNHFSNISRYVALSNMAKNVVTFKRIRKIRVNS